VSIEDIPAYAEAKARMNAEQEAIVRQARTAQPSPDLPDSLRRDRKHQASESAAARGDMRIEIVKRELNQGALAGLQSTVTGYAAGLVVAALDSFDEESMAAEFRRGFEAGELNAGLRAVQAEADLAAMTARAERMRPVLVAARSWLTQETNGRGISPADDRLITALRTYDETDPLWALSATQTASGVEVAELDVRAESEGQRGSEGVSGGAA